MNLKEERVAVNGLEYHLVSCGAGKPIILLHPYGSSVYAWRHIIGEFKDGYKVYAYDQKGFGRSTRPPRADYSLASYAGELNGIMDAIGLEKAVLIGHSFGGGVAIQAAASFPERFTKVILIDALSYVTPNPPLAFRLMRLPLLGRFLANFNNALVTRLVMREAFYHKALVTRELAREYFRPLRDKRAAQVLYGVDRQCFRPERERELEKKIPLITQPTLIIWGENDPWLPVEMARRLNKDIVHSTLRLIPQCGHSPLEEKPAEVIREINRFL